MLNDDDNDDDHHRHHRGCCDNDNKDSDTLCQVEPDLKSFKCKQKGLQTVK